MTGVVCTPLRTEWLALRNRLGPELVRTGRALGPRDDLTRGPVLVTGVAGALTGHLAPGDVVVASELRHGSTSYPSHASIFVVGALRRRGLLAHHGPLLTTGRVVGGSAERRMLARTGAIAVDTESALFAGRGGQTVALRSIVDTPRLPLRRPGTAARGVRALRSLRRSADVIAAWSAATGEREVFLARSASVARDCDLLLVLGSPNACDVRLRQECKEAGTPVHMVGAAEDVELAWLAGIHRVGITAGASAFPNLLADVVRGLEGLGAVTVHQSVAVDENIRLPLSREVS